jgi:NAD(P)H-hydrate epimerase
MIRLTRAQVREIDRRAIEEYHIPGIVLMENAARSLADVVPAMLDNPAGVVSIVCGGGNNGGDGFALARHLSIRRIRVNVCLVTEPSALKGDALANYRILCAMRTVNMWQHVEGQIGMVCPGASTRLIVDAIFGTGLSRPPGGLAASAIDLMNAADVPIVAVDVPSGLDCNTGEPLGACVKATQTVTFVAEKVGFANPDSKQYTGEITVGDIGCPRELIEEVAKMNLT